MYLFYVDDEKNYENIWRIDDNTIFNSRLVDLRYKKVVNYIWIMHVDYIIMNDHNRNES